MCDFISTNNFGSISYFLPIIFLLLNSKNVKFYYIFFLILTHWLNFFGKNISNNSL